MSRTLTVKNTVLRAARKWASQFHSFFFLLFRIIWISAGHSSVDRLAGGGPGVKIKDRTQMETMIRGHTNLVIRLPSSIVVAHLTCRNEAAQFRQLGSANDRGSIESGSLGHYFKQVKVWRDRRLDLLDSFCTMDTFANEHLQTKLEVANIQLRGIRYYVRIN